MNMSINLPYFKKSNSSWRIVVLALITSVLIGCGDAPTPTPAKFSLLSGNNQEGPAKGKLPKPIVVQFNEATQINATDTGDILIEYKITKGNGTLSVNSAIVRLPEVLGHSLEWTLGDFGDQTLQITAKWVSSQKALEGSPIVVKASTETVSDADNNSYNVVQIGDQVWIGANLKTTKYNDGSNITHMPDEIDWVNTSVNESAGYCWYKNDVSNATPYGALYNYYAATSTKLCPTGWHVPSDAEFQTLVTFAGGEAIAAKKLKEAGLDHWFDKNEGTNELLFTAVGGGIRTNVNNNQGAWGNPPGSEELWHTTTSLNNNQCISYFIPYESNSLVREGSASNTNNIKEYGSSIRCIRD